MMAFMAVRLAAKPIVFIVGIDDTTGTMPDYSRIPPVPVVDLTDNVLTFLPDHDDYTVSIVDEEGNEVYSVFVPSSVITVTLPFVPGGNYVLRLLTDDFYYYYATFTDPVVVDGIRYKLVNKTRTAEVVKKRDGSYPGDIMLDDPRETEWYYSGDIVIPDEIVYYGKRYSVKSIGDYAFNWCRKMTSVTIPCSLTTIGIEAFKDCKNLSAVYISDLAKWCCIEFRDNPVTSIDGTTISNPLSYAHHLFLDGKEVTNLVIPDEVKKIPDKAFYRCYSLTSVDTGNGVTAICSDAFYGCSNLTSVTIGNSVKTVGENAFGGCTNLGSVSIGSSVTTIERWAFANTGLTSITIPNSVTTIWGAVFENCKELTTVTLGTGVKTFSWISLRNCPKFEALHISDLAAWCDIDFGSELPPSNYRLNLNGTVIKDLVIPDGVTVIKDHAFKCLTQLSSVTIPNSVTTIGASVFASCTSLMSVSLPSSLKTIGDGAFVDCPGLTSFVIPDGLTTISSATFAACTNLRYVKFPSKLESIEERAFVGCKSLMSVTIPNSTTKIGRASFCDCGSLATVTLGSGIESIGSGAFSSCPELANVYCFATKVPKADETTFHESYPSYCNLYVPASLVEAYKASRPWNEFIIAGVDDEDIPTPEPQKCATPTIAFENGELTFSCETDGVEFVSEITVDEARKYYDSKVRLDGKYVVTVYAVKRDFEDSDVATAVIYPGQSPSVRTVYDVNGDGTVDVADISAIITAMAEM